MAPRRLARSRPRRQPGDTAQPLDRWAVSVMVTLILVLAVLILGGDQAAARVRDFSWQQRQVGAEDRAFLLTFSRPMDRASVEANLRLSPLLPGKVSWAGRRMAYTLTEPIPYGQTFTLSLPQASDRFSAQNGKPSRFQPFQSEFQSRPRAFLYIGSQGEEANRLVLANLARRQRLILTPKNLVVLDFKPYPLGDRVLFSATDREQGDVILNQQLYTVTTGIQIRPPEALLGESDPAWRPSGDDSESGQLELVLDNRQYQNLKFDLSADGQVTVVQRVNRQDPTDFGPWVVRAGQDPYRLETEPGGDFMIAPDSQSLVLLQGEGTAIIDLAPDTPAQAGQTLDFLPGYGQVLDIAADGTAAALVNFNQNDPKKRFMESLFWVTNQGREEELLTVSGTILDAQFDARQNFLYVLASELLTDPSQGNLSTEGYLEQPLLLAVNLKTQAITKLLLLPQGPRIHMSLAPDGRSLLLDLDRQEEQQQVRGGTQGGVLPPEIWYLALSPPSDQSGPQVTNRETYPFQGLQATWLP